MTAEQIKELIKIELIAEPDIKNVFGLDLTKYLIEPTKQTYKESNDAVETYTLWTVLEEAQDGNGYKIYFDDDTNNFGLAIKSDKGELVDIGNFLKTRYSM